MRKRIPFVLVALVAFGANGAAALADGCSGRSHATGSILGALGGGLIGNAITHGNAVGTVGGAVAGGFAGNAIARDIDCDRGRHHDRQVRRYYWYDRHGHRVYEERYGRAEHRYYDRERYGREDRDRDEYHR